MSTETNPALVRIVERDALDSPVQLGVEFAGVATVLQQIGEPIEQTLQRIARRAHDLQVSGYSIVAASLVLGPPDGQRLCERTKIARGLLRLIDARGVLHFEATHRADPLTPFAVADQLTPRPSGPAIKIHFPKHRPAKRVRPAASNGFGAFGVTPEECERLASLAS